MVSTRLAPALRGLDVDLDHAGIGRHLDDFDARIVGRRIALDMHLHLHFLGGRLDRRDQREIVLELFDRRHEGAEHAVAELDRHRRAHGARACVLGSCAGFGGALPVRASPVVDRRARSAAPAGPARRCRDSRSGNMRQRRERQPQAERRIARDQEQLAAPQLPALAHPARPRLGRVPAQDRQHIAAGVFEALRRTRAPCARALRDPRVLDRRDRHWPAGCLLLQPVRRDPRRPA